MMEWEKKIGEGTVVLQTASNIYRKMCSFRDHTGLSGFRSGRLCISISVAPVMMGDKDQEVKELCE